MKHSIPHRHQPILLSILSVIFCIAVATSDAQIAPPPDAHEIKVAPGQPLQQVLASAPDGAEIQLSEGRYAAPAGGFVIDSKRRIMLFSQGAAVLEGADPSSPVLTVRGVFNVVVQGLRMTHPGAAAGEKMAPVIKVEDSLHLYFDGCLLQGGLHALDVSETHVLRMHGGAASGQSAAAFHVANCRSISIRHMEISHNVGTPPEGTPGQVLWCQDSDATVFTHNNVRDNKNAAFARISTGYFRVMNNTFSGNTFPVPDENEPAALVPADEAAHFTKEFTSAAAPEKKGEFMHLGLEGRWQNSRGEWFDLVENTATRQLEAVPLSSRLRRLWTFGECKSDASRILVTCTDPAIESPIGGERKLSGQINEAQTRIIWENGRGVWERDAKSPPVIAEEDKKPNYDNILVIESLGGLKLGMDDKAVTKLLGKAVVQKSKNLTRPESDFVFQTWTCPEKGLSLCMVPVDKGRMELISITATKKCDFSTLKGIKVGSTLDEVRQAYGEPEKQGGPDDVLVGNVLNASGIFFTIKGGKVTQIFFGTAT
ncbi:MAG: hypothetical protein JNG86_02750 [Verrucomicrobiaceae bacterium]|nr:hypothetical protein [Verrucomicrobiaceae bacterium]